MPRVGEGDGTSSKVVVDFIFDGTPLYEKGRMVGGNHQLEQRSNEDKSYMSELLMQKGSILLFRGLEITHRGYLRIDIFIHVEYSELDYMKKSFLCICDI